MNQPSQIIHDGAILRYINSTDRPYVFCLENNPEPSTIVNSADTKNAAKSADINF